MADYTLQNLKEVDDAAPKFGMPPGIEARFARTAIEGTSLGLSYLKLEPGFRIPFGHRHEQQEEVYLVLAGSARLKLDDEIVDVKEWDAVRVGKGTMRNFEAGSEGAEIVAFGAGENQGDAEVVPGWWSD